MGGLVRGLKRDDVMKGSLCRQCARGYRACSRAVCKPTVYIVTLHDHVPTAFVHKTFLQLI